MEGFLLSAADREYLHTNIAMTSPFAFLSDKPPLEYLLHELFGKVDRTIKILKNEKFPSHDDRIRRIFQLLSDEKIVIPSTKVPPKSQSKATEHRNKGNNYFRMNSLNDACDEYTMSIAWAPPGSQELAMAYANRSAVLFKANFMADCLEDIDRSLASNYPDNLKAKLYLRKAACLQALCPDDSSAIEAAFSEVHKWLNKMDEKNKSIMQKMVKEQAKNIRKTEPIICHKLEDIDQGPCPKLQNENPKIPGLSDAVELAYSEKWGRHCIAARDIEIGELLGVQKPYIKIAHAGVMYRICWHCGRQTWSGLACSGCPVVIYCSDKCRDDAQTMYHDLECRVIQECRDYSIPQLNLVGLKLTILAYKEAGCSLDQLKKNVQQFNFIKDRENQGFTDGVLRPDKFASTQGLFLPSVESLNREGKSGECISVVVAIILSFFLAKSMNLIEEKIEIIDISIINDDLKFLVSFIANNINRTLPNIEELQVLSNKDDDNIFRHELIPAFSFFNLSCIRTVIKYRYGDYSVLKSVCPIKKGQQIFLSQCFYSHEPKHERRVEMLVFYDFVCDCKACTDNWPVHDFTKIDEYLKNKKGLEGDIREYVSKVETLRDNMTNYALKNKKLMDVTNDINEGVRILHKAYKSLGEKSSLFAVATVFFDLTHRCSDMPFINLN